jgi:hypothetical protein
MNAIRSAALWKRRFFEAQASAEEFITTRYGLNGITEWINTNAAITARLLRSEKPRCLNKARHFALRLYRQLKLYDSDIAISRTSDGYKLTNSQCGILRYRQEASTQGVRLTFESPCDYCRTLNSRIYANYAEDNAISCELKPGGCVWTLRHV